MAAMTETGEQLGNVEPSARASKPPETGPFVLRALLEDLPLSADGDREDIEINCVEFLGIYLLVTMLPETCANAA